MLQLANSAVFGLELQVSQPLEAIAYIGLETTKALVLLAHTVSTFEKSKLPGFSVEALWRHSVNTGQIAQKIALMEKGGTRKTAEQAFAAGLLHDLGKLLFCANLPGLFAKTLTLAREDKCSFWEAESQLFPNAGHAELAGCMLGIWGLPQPIVEAVALHHNPRRLNSQGFHPLTAVHAANILDHDMTMDESGLASHPDQRGLSGGIGADPSRRSLAPTLHPSEPLDGRYLALDAGVALSPLNLAISRGWGRFALAMPDISSMNFDMGGLLASVVWGRAGHWVLDFTARKQSSGPALIGGIALVVISIFMANSALLDEPGRIRHYGRRLLLVEAGLGFASEVWKV